MGETSRMWKQGLLGVPAAYQHPPDCRRWSAHSVPPHVFRLPNNMLVPHFEIGEFYWGKKKSLCTSWIMQDEHHAKLMPLPAKLLNYISLPYFSVYSPMFVCGCLTTLHSWCFERWRGVCLSPLSDIRDDWNINGLCRAEHKQYPGTFIEQSRGCGAAMSGCEWSKTVLSVTFQTSKAVFGVIWASFWSFYFKFRKILEVKDLKRNPTYSSGLCTIWRCFWPQWKHKKKKKRKVNNEPLRQQQK